MDSDVPTLTLISYSMKNSSPVIRFGRIEKGTKEKVNFKRNQMAKMDEYAYVVNVDGVVVRDDEYLLIERSDDEEHAAGALAFPGGKIEHRPGEAEVIGRTARRELYEEVGVEIGAVEYVFSSTFEAGDGTPCINVLTLCEHVSGDPYPRATAEVADVHWLTASEIRRRDPPEYFLRYIDLIEAYRHGGQD